MCMVTCFDWPASSSTRPNWASDRTANCTPDGASLGAPTYTCTASAPAVEPVFLTSTVTSAPPSAVCATFSPEKANVVKDRPYPNGNCGVMPSLSKYGSPVPEQPALPLSRSRCWPAVLPGYRPFAGSL